MPATITYWKNGKRHKPSLTGPGKIAVACNLLQGHIDAINAVNPTLDATIHANLSAKEGEYGFRFTGTDKEKLYTLFMARF